MLNFIRRWSHIRISLEVQISCSNVILLVNFWKPICSLDIVFIQFWDACGKVFCVVVMFIPPLGQRSRDEVVVTNCNVFIHIWIINWLMALKTSTDSWRFWNCGIKLLRNALPHCCFFFKSRWKTFWCSQNH